MKLITAVSLAWAAIFAAPALTSAQYPQVAYYAPTTVYYSTPAVTTYVNPAVSYYRPSMYTSYYAPTAYYYPSTSYYAPATTYYAPTTSYYSPAASYYTPTTSYYVPSGGRDYPVLRSAVAEAIQAAPTFIR